MVRYRRNYRLDFAPNFILAVTGLARRDHPRGFVGLKCLANETLVKRPDSMMFNFHSKSLPWSIQPFRPVASLKPSQIISTVLLREQLLNVVSVDLI